MRTLQKKAGRIFARRLSVAIVAVTANVGSLMGCRAEGVGWAPSDVLDARLTRVKVDKAFYAAAGSSTYIGLEVHSLREWWLAEIFWRFKQAPDVALLLFIRSPSSSDVRPLYCAKQCQAQGGLRIGERYGQFGALDSVLLAERQPDCLRLWLTVNVENVAVMLHDVSARHDSAVLVGMLQSAKLRENKVLARWAAEISAAVETNASSERKR